MGRLERGKNGKQNIGKNLGSFPLRMSPGLGVTLSYVSTYPAAEDALNN